MATFTDFLLSFSSESLKKGYQFEYFVKWFLETDPAWSTQVERIWLWKEFPGRWGADCGVDLVFKHKNGDIWAVQAKCYSSEYSITKQDIDKFLSESNRNVINKRLLITTTDKIGMNAKKVCEAQEKPIIRFMLSNFEDAEIDYPVSINELSKAKRRTAPLPFPYQHEAVSAVSQKFQFADRGQLIMACGTGKTFTTLWVKEKISAQNTLVLLPSLGLLSQTLKEWTFGASYPFASLCVCSDQTVGNYDDEYIHTVGDLAFPVTSNVEDIKIFLKAEGGKVIFSTYQSSPLIEIAQKDCTVPTFDLVVADEAHRCAGKVGNVFTIVLNDNRIRSRMRLFATATPRTYSRAIKKKIEIENVQIASMDDVNTFGKIFYSLKFGEAIEKGLLTDYQVVIVGVSDPMIKESIQKRDLISLDSKKITDMETLAGQIGLIKAIKDYNLKRVISFHSRVKRAESFAEDFPKVIYWLNEKERPSGLIQSDYVSGEMPVYKRKQKINQLKDSINDTRSLLANAQCLAEGVDVPSLDGVAFIDPRSSQVAIIQAVGRSIRLNRDKKIGTIILPVFIQEDEDAAISIEKSSFKPIWDVLNALKSHDDVLAFELDQLRTKLGRKTDYCVGSGDFSKIM